MNALEMALEALTNPSTIAVSHAIDLIKEELAKPVNNDYVDIHCPSCLHSFAIVPVAKREWVGLTDDEIKHIMDCWRNGYIDIKKAEQLLKDKNT